MPLDAIPPYLPPLLVVGGLLLALRAGRQLFAALDATPVAEAPVSPTDTLLSFPNGGDVVLHLEGPLFTPTFRGVRVVLTDATGRPVPGRMVLVRASRTTMQRVRLAVRRFRLDGPGSYRVRCEGLPADPAYADCRLVFTLPYAGVAFGTAATFGAALATSLVGAALFVAPLLPDETAPAGESADPPPAAGAPRAHPAAAGRALRNDATVTSWRDVVWPDRRVRLRVPSDWIETERSPNALELRAPDRRALVVVRVWPFALPTTAAQVVAAIQDTAATRHAQGQLEGYALRTLGTTTGVLSIPPAGDGWWLASWNAFDGVGATGRAVDVAVGADGTQLPAVEPVLGAILDSVRIE